jgi:hypothetical protein
MDTPPDALMISDVDALRAAKSLREKYGASAKDMVEDLISASDETERELILILKKIKALL